MFLEGEAAARNLESLGFLLPARFEGAGRRVVIVGPVLQKKSR